MTKNVPSTNSFESQLWFTAQRLLYHVPERPAFPSICCTPHGVGFWVHHKVFTNRPFTEEPKPSSMSREREDTGRYTETVTLDGVLSVFETVDGPVVTSGDVAEALDCSRETARRKLRTLEEQGKVASRKTAGRVVWWVVDEQESVRGIDPEDSFWEFEPGASGESDVSENVDEVLYGKESA